VNLGGVAAATGPGAGSGGGSASGSGSGSSSVRNTARSSSKPPPPVRAVLCVTTSPLLSYSDTLLSASAAPSTSSAATAQVPVPAPPPMASPKASSSSSPKVGSVRAVAGTPAESEQLFTLSPLDVRRVLHTLAKWQQASPDRAVLLAAPGGVHSDAAEGHARPFVLTAAGKEITSDAEFDNPKNVHLDIWNRERSMLAQLLVGDLSRTSRASSAYFQDTMMLQLRQQATDMDDDTAVAALTVTDRSTLFKSYFEPATQCVRRCFWDVCFAPQRPPRPAPGTFTGVRAAPPAAFLTDCVTDGRYGNVHVALGPVIGAVTTNSACVLVQVGFFFINILLEHSLLFMVIIV
jgi:hypothetical protein